MTGRRAPSAARPDAIVGDSALDHVAFLALGDGVSPRRRSLDDVQLTDQQRLAVVLQGVAVLAHCVHGGWRAPRDWPVGTDGLLRLDPPILGPGPALPQRVAAALLRTAFRAEGEIAGRGTARRAARRLAQRFDQALEPVAADRLVEWILGAAPFLWDEAFGGARCALVARHVRPTGAHLWIVGPGRARHRLLAAGRSARAGLAARDAEELAIVQDLLAGPSARDLWDGHRPGDDPQALAAQGQLRRAVAAWRRRARLGADALPFAATLFALGRHQECLDRLARRGDPESLLLRARAQMELGERHAVAKTLGRLELRDLAPARQVEAAEVAVRLAAGKGHQAVLERWEARLETWSAAGGRAPAERGLALVVAAGAAWDRDAIETMSDRLERAEPLCRAGAGTGATTALRRWLQAEGLRRLVLGDGDGAAKHLAQAIGCGRRQMGRAEAGRLWSDLAVVRVAADDLAGAERACRQAARLLGDWDGTAGTTLALYNLAEVRLRRGRIEGVEITLERSTVANRRADNARGVLRDYELWARFELALGRPRGALARIAEAERVAARQGAPARGAVFRLLAARALGWLGRADEAAEALRDGGAEALDELEPEERPAIWALAGQVEPALRAAQGTPWQGLWSALVEGLPPSLEAFDAMDRLSAYRAARLGLDIDCALAGALPARRRLRAIETFRRLGASGWIDRLGGADSAWRALRRYLEAPPGPRLEALPELFEAAGYGGARLTFAHRGDEIDLVRGAGEAAERLRIPVAGGDLSLFAERLDPALHALAWVAARTTRPSVRDSAPDSSRAREAGPRSNVAGPAVGELRGGVIGQSEALLSTLDRLDRLAVGDLPLLVQGESGTGKELAARRAHRGSRRADGPFVAINCAALSESLIQSDLFGHVRGAFTGADRDRAGVFEAARGGTVFLDEVGDLPSAAQGKLLRVLQEKEVRRLGESLTRTVDVRVVAATHRDLAAMVDAGDFRQDLYFRLRVATVTLPPLRDRGSDVLLLAEHFLAQLPTAPRLLPEARNQLLEPTWPGNIRELRNVLEVAAALAAGGDIGVEHLELPGASAARSASAAAQGDYHGQIERFRRRLISQALQASGGNQSQAARQLGLSRQALSYLVRQLDLN